MRMFLLLRGLPGSGKSTFIKENNLSDYTVSADNLRLILGSNELNIDGSYKVNQSVSKTMWKILYNILEYRFKIGAFTILDATNIKTKDIKKASKLAKEYRYRVYCLDFTEVEISSCIKRDALRDKNKQVGEKVIRRMADELITNTIPGGIKVIKPEDWLLETKYREIDLSSYDKIHHIGDIHGCFSVLNEYFKDGLKENEFYIFLGDYIDRGIENNKVIYFLASIADSPNVVLLEGNHERWLKKYIKDEKCSSITFEKETRVELDSDKNIKQKCSTIIRKLRQCFIYSYHGKTVLCTHGGLSKYPENLSLINSNDMIEGVGRYSDMLNVNESFLKSVGKREIYQIHGHRNIEQAPIKINERCFNLNGCVELGGDLKILTLDKEGFDEIRLVNNIYRKSDNAKFHSIKEMTDRMKESESIKVIKQHNTDIISLNFTKDAFHKGNWNGITTKARGMFVNEESQKIVARGYEKFFNINESPETNFDRIKNTFIYPVTAYKKENGFLGILSYDEDIDKLLFCSKSTLEGEFSDLFRDVLLSFVKEDDLLKEIKNKDISLLFEVIDPVNDSHIIRYNSKRVYLLDIVENKIEFIKKPYEEVVNLARRLNIPCKERCAILEDKEAFVDFYLNITADDFKYKEKFIEGFVFEDSNLFMVKQKTKYYVDLKRERTQVEKIKKHKAPRYENDFLRWVIDNENKWFLDFLGLKKEYELNYKVDKVS